LWSLWRLWPQLVRENKDRRVIKARKAHRVAWARKAHRVIKVLRDPRVT
jgi:hypothetical protein